MVPALAVMGENWDTPAVNPFVILLICIAGWMSRNQQDVIEYLQEEVRVLKELLAAAAAKELRKTSIQIQASVHGDGLSFFDFEINGLAAIADRTGFVRVRMDGG